MLRYKTEIARFSRIVKRPARKRSGSILTTLEPTRGTYYSGDYSSFRQSPSYVFNKEPLGLLARDSLYRSDAVADIKPTVANQRRKL